MKHKHMWYEFERNKVGYNKIYFGIVGSYIIFPSVSAYKKEALKELKERLHKMVEELK